MVTTVKRLSNIPYIYCTYNPACIAINAQLFLKSIFGKQVYNIVMVAQILLRVYSTLILIRKFVGLKESSDRRDGLVLLLISIFVEIVTLR